MLWQLGVSAVSACMSDHSSDWRSVSDLMYATAKLREMRERRSPLLVCCVCVCEGCVRGL